MPVSLSHAHCLLSLWLCLCLSLCLCLCPRLLSHQSSTGGTVGQDAVPVHGVDPLSSAGFTVGGVTSVTMDTSSDYPATSVVLSSVSLPNGASMVVTMKLVYSATDGPHMVAYGPAGGQVPVRMGSVVVNVEVAGWQFCEGTGCVADNVTQVRSGTGAIAVIGP